MRYVKDSDIWTKADIRRAHTGVSFPRGDWDVVHLAELGYVPLVETPAPAALPWHRVVEGAPAGDMQTWVQQPMSEGEIEAACEAALEQHYDAVAAQRRYDSRITCALRAGYAGPFQAEGAAFAVWMDGCNDYAYSVMAGVAAGLRQPPVSTEALVDELPVLVWPA